MLATWVSLHYHRHVYKKIGNQPPQLAKTNADKYFSCIDYIGIKQYLSNNNVQYLKSITKPSTEWSIYRNIILIIAVISEQNS